MSTITLVEPDRLPLLSIPLVGGEPQTHASDALYIAEVLAMVLDQLGDDKQSLHHVALTCKGFTELTLDHLWARNDSLEPFIALLPEELKLNDESNFVCDPAEAARLPAEKWATFDKYARRARRLYVRTVTMTPYRVYSSIYQQLTAMRPNVELFPNLRNLIFHAKSRDYQDLRFFPSSLRSLTLSWSNVVCGEREGKLWSATMNRLFLDAPLIEKVYFEGSPRDPLEDLTPLPFKHLREIRIKCSPIFPNVLHAYCHALSASSILELDLRFVGWPDARIEPLSPVFPSLKKLAVDGSPSRAIDFVRRLSSPTLQELVLSLPHARKGEPIALYAQLFGVIAEKYRGVFKKLAVQYSLVCHNQAELELFLGAVRKLVDAGLHELEMYLVVGWCDLTPEVQDMIKPSNWAGLKNFWILSPRMGQRPLC
ncbi:hypothetical protein HYDPIDRAFT_106307 [Hydnomerulius pinastri MD-312]|nr:hypothetical protein HYDPIDRAFT_106307 [Hydnomerulius pinastri MD-312]